MLFAIGFVALNSMPGESIDVPEIATDADLDSPLLLTITDPEWQATVGADLKRTARGIVAAIDPIDRKATAAGAARFEAQMAAGPVQTASMGPQWPAARTGVAFTINADLTKRRYNLFVGPELREWIVSPGNWRDPAFRATVKVDANGNFPVRIIRMRLGVTTLITTMWVPAGPSAGMASMTLQTRDWRRGDKLIVAMDSPALMVVESRESGAVFHPWISGIEIGSGDGATIPGKVMTW